MTDATKVVGAAGAGVTTVTPNAPLGVANATPETVSPDAEWARRLAEEKAAAVAEARKETELHVGRVKSTLQSQIAQIERERDEERSALRRQMFEQSIAGKDETERMKFENKFFQDQLSESEAKLQALDLRLQEETAKQAYFDWFAGLGVPATKLVKDQGLQVLLQSGWEATQERVQELEAKANAAVAVPAPAPAPASAPPAGTITPPTVVVGNVAPPGVKATWPELVTKYGFPVDDVWARDAIYDKANRGEISWDTIPD